MSSSRGRCVYDVGTLCLFGGHYGNFKRLYVLGAFGP